MNRITTRIAILLSILVLSTINSYTLKAQDTTSIFYKLDAHQLTFENTSILDSLLYFNIIKDNKKIIIVGYTDFLGDTAHNNILSQKRAEGVKNYLTQMSVNQNAIVICIGKGEIPRAHHVPVGYAADRRVDIVLNSTQPTATNTTSSTSNSPPLKIDKVSIGKTIVLNKIFFHTGRHFITDESLPELENLYQTLKDNPTLKIRIEGHVCCVWYGPDALDEDTHEIALSVNRAKYIYDYLVNKGISADRLDYIGFGRRRPLVRQERTAADEALNRRVEIRVISR